MPPRQSTMWPTTQHHTRVAATATREEEICKIGSERRSTAPACFQGSFTWRTEGSDSGRGWLDLEPEGTTQRATHAKDWPQPIRYTHTHPQSHFQSVYTTAMRRRSCPKIKLDRYISSGCNGASASPDATTMPGPNTLAAPKTVAKNQIWKGP
jgi:arylamine N-acetyltransferase